MLTVNFWPALAVTPHTGSLLVSVLVWLPVNSWQDKVDVGAAVGSGEIINEGRVVGAEVGTRLGAGVGRKIGAVVGEYVTKCTPAPAMAAVPAQVEEPVQPSRMM